MQNRRGDGCPSPWPLGRPWKRERMRWRVINEVLMGKVVEVQFWKRKWDFWKFKTLWLRDKGREKEKEKGKKIELKGYFP